jgi:hypothetical protein
MCLNIDRGSFSYVRTARALNTRTLQRNCEYFYLSNKSEIATTAEKYNNGRAHQMARAVAECVPTKRAGLNAAASEGPAKSSPSSDSSSAGKGESS